MRKFSKLIMLMASLIAVGQKKNDPSIFAKTITTDDLKKHLFIVAGKEMEGRETATEGQRKAAAYIENAFRTLGLRPGNGHSYQLYYPVFQDSLETAELTVNDHALARDKDSCTAVCSNSTAALPAS